MKTIKLKLTSKDVKMLERIEVKDLFESIEPAKEMVRKALKLGVKNPKVKIVLERYNEVWSIISKIDIEEKIVKAQNLTEREQETLKKILEDYKKSGIENCNYGNVFGDDNKNKSVVGSLVRKHIIYINQCPGCFNPMFPSYNMIPTCEKYNIEICNEVKEYLE